MAEGGLRRRGGSWRNARGSGLQYGPVPDPSRRWLGLDLAAVVRAPQVVRQRFSRHYGGEADPRAAMARRRRSGSRPGSCRCLLAWCPGWRPGRSPPHRPCPTRPVITRRFPGGSAAHQLEHRAVTHAEASIADTRRDPVRRLPAGRCRRWRGRSPPADTSPSGSLMPPDAVGHVARRWDAPGCRANTQAAVKNRRSSGQGPYWELKQMVSDEASPTKPPKVTE